MLQAIYPNFILHKHWEMPDAFDDGLAAIAMHEATGHRLTREDNPRNLGNLSNHFGHVRHNMLEDQKADPHVRQLLGMVRSAIAEFLISAYGYTFDGEVSASAETFYQDRARGENLGIFTHSHRKSDFVVTYYPLVEVDPEYVDDQLRSGALRFYDPAGVGQRLWPNNNPQVHCGSWFQIIPRTGSMVVFEGHVPHDSSYFAGARRVCIPVQCDLVLPNSQVKTRIGGAHGL